MARPCKSASMLTICSQTKEEIRVREAQEKQLKGDGNKVIPPGFLNKEQRRIFRSIVKELEPSGILGNLDVYILTQCAVAIDRLQTMEQMINEDPELLTNSCFMASKDKYSKDLYRCCNELSLSPQSRAKMANINLQTKQQQEDPLLQVLRGGKP